MWPSDVVKDAVEEIGTVAAFDGFRIGVFNEKGPTKGLIVS
jgi:hypothetical protein